ncbi:GyrI-like domain-containing protein [Enterococcus quebecensis]|uniref:AraC effector-binding domain-containing protein n=1 Tax=Enterococcus quebecensis TaxID=903983 RepID=A0A1E5GTT4_9ENTE|nr:GyrI-like domain-containing protein [Enterococcus quebecensis]OEG16088.1 hypothetical protein BCR23_06555 [Enterococcus quebecensis]
MDYQITKKAAFTITGYTKKMIKIEKNENFYDISRFWSNLTEEKITKLLSVSDGQIPALLGVSDNNRGEFSQFNYTIGVASNQGKVVKSELIETKFPESDWAIFECIGAISAGVEAIDEGQSFEPNVLMQLKNRTYSPWSDAAINENIAIPRVEFYPLGNMEAVDYRCELWVPIK